MQTRIPEYVLHRLRFWFTDFAFPTYVSLVGDCMELDMDERETISLMASNDLEDIQRAGYLFERLKRQVT